MREEQRKDDLLGLIRKWREEDEKARDPFGYRDEVGEDAEHRFKIDTEEEAAEEYPDAAASLFEEWRAKGGVVDDVTLSPRHEFPFRYPVQAINIGTFEKGQVISRGGELLEGVLIYTDSGKLVIRVDEELMETIDIHMLGDRESLFPL